MEANEVRLRVIGWPPAKNEAKSLLAAGHTHAQRVMDLLEAARAVVADRDVPFGSQPIGLELTISSPSQPPADATNFLGGVGDVLEAKGNRGALDHLGTLGTVGLYENDRQIHEVRYRWRQGADIRYSVRIWMLAD